MKYIIFGAILSACVVGTYFFGYNDGKRVGQAQQEVISNIKSILHDKTSTPREHEYQIRVEMDSMYLYNWERVVGSCPIGKDGLDSLILMDNL